MVKLQVKTPKVSILVPVYNVEKYIHRCIDSILAQTFTDFECILVNDCTPDNSGKICDEYALKDKRIKVIHKTQNQGLPQARKTGFEHSSGDYIQFVDSDDWIEPEMLEALYQKAVSESLDLTICDFFLHTKDDGIETVSQKDFFCYDKIDTIKLFLKKDIEGYLWNKFASKELISLVTFPEYNSHEDSVVTVQNLHFARKIGIINIPFYHYCYNPQSILNNKTKRSNRSIEISGNWKIILGFLKTQYGQLTLFEPELSNRINGLKKWWFFDSRHNRLKELLRIYPESNFYRYLFLYMIKTTIKTIFPRKILSNLSSEKNTQLN